MKNLRMLFSQYHAGFQDFGPWLDHYREMHRRHPLECAEFGEEWLRRWEAVGKLFNGDGCTEWLQRKSWRRGVIKSMRLCFEHAWYIWKSQRIAIRVVLLDGTLIREWPASP